MDGRAIKNEENGRSLFEIWGVSEDSGSYVIVIGLILVGIAVLACCYCKVYDPAKLYTIKCCKKFCSKKPRLKPPPPPEVQTPEEVSPNAPKSSIFFFWRHLVGDLLVGSSCHVF